MQRTPVDSGWTLHLLTEAPAEADPGIAGAAIPATVPGTVHTDLLDHGLIPDPYLDENEAGLRWLWRSSWRYETTLEHAPGADDRIDLVCDGLDTIATVELNGELLGRTQNMHRSYRFDLRGRLQPGSNRLSVTFASALDHAEAEQQRMGPLPIPNSASVHPINFIRKMACNFGWDWGPVLITAGIWKPVTLERWSTARLAGVRPQVGVAAGVGRVRVAVDLERAGTDGELTVRAEVAGATTSVTVPAGATSAVVELEVADPELWWPHSHGDQPLYDLRVALSGADAELDTWTRRVGFRTIELDTSRDEIGQAFTFVVNGLPVFARGANWIPDDCFPTRITAARYRERLEQSRDANVDLLRVWGGGIYESDDFYDAADELGILVWQDFLFACAGYPEEEPIRSEVEAEARENVARLMPHASLALWNGNNENFMGWHEWGWPELVGERTWGLGYYLDLLPSVVAEVDGSRPYWPGSPYSGSPERASGLDGWGCKHVWDVWNTADYPTYRDYVPRFVSEFGWQSPPTWSTLTASVHDDPLAPDSAGVLAHQKATDGNGKLARGLAPHFPVPNSMADWHFANQLNQSRAIAFGIEHWRAHRGECMGTIVWQLNDCWPVTSWAAIDGYARLKPLWYTLRRVYAPQLLTLQPGPDGLQAVLVNDGRLDWSVDLVVQRVHADGSVLAETTVRGSAAPAEVTRLALPVDLVSPAEPASEFLVATTAGHRATHFFVEDLDHHYAKPDYDLVLTPTDGGLEVAVTAKTVLRDLTLFADRLSPDATVDDMLVTVLPGETHRFTVSGSGLDPADLTPAVLRTANDIA